MRFRRFSVGSTEVRCPWCGAQALCSPSKGVWCGRCKNGTVR